MKSLVVSILAPLGLAAMVAAPAHAADLAMQSYWEGVTGNLGLWKQAVIPSGYDSELSTDICVVGDGPTDFCIPGWGFGGDARLFHNMGDGTGIQLEILADFHTSLDPCTADECGGDIDEVNMPALFAALGGHWITRDSDSAFGIFGGVSGVRHMAGPDGAVHVFKGVEAAWFGDQTHFYAQAGGVLFVHGDDALRSMVFGRGGFRIFASENAMFEGSFGGGFSPNYDSDSTDPVDDALWLQAAATFEQQVGSSPWSWFAGYQGDYIIAFEEINGDESVLVHTIKGGVRLNIGESLEDEALNGSRTFQFMNLRAPIAYAGELN